MSHIDVTDSDFEQKVLKADKPVLVDFWAVWCGPCKMQNPILEELEAELGDTAIVAKVDVDKNPGSAQQYGIMSIPTIMIFKNGKVTNQFIGVQSKETLRAALQ